MKSLFQLALATVLFGSCTKLDEIAVPGKTIPQIAEKSTITNLGHVFTGTNITWKIHPLDPNNTPLFTKLPGQNAGYCQLFIDNGVLNGMTPINAFRFVAVNLATQQAKIVPVIAANGNPATYSLGRIVRYTFGMDKKFYVATEGTPTGGGHLVQYDPETQTAKDLGKPFKIGNKFLDIYTLNVGTDGALYGGSFGGDGEVKTFRYDYNNLEVDNEPLDNSSRYVAYISGDSRYTYAVCGKNNWVLYAKDRKTGEIKTLKRNAGSATPISVGPYSDGIYAHSVATHYKLSGFDIKALPEYERPLTNRIYYVPYAENDANVPKVMWDDVNRKVIYQMSNSQTIAINVEGLQQDIYSTSGPTVYFNNKLYVSSYKQGIIATYAPGEGFQKIGYTSMGIHAMAVPCVKPENANKIFLGGYPKGGLLEYNTARQWSVNLAGFSYTSGSGFATTSTNPSQQGLFQNADASGVNGSMDVLGMACTKNGYIVSAGNNDRITASSSRELSMGSCKNGVIRNLYLPEFSNYEFQSFSLSKDSNYAIIGAVPKAGNNARLYKYDPATNSVVKSWNITLWGDRYLKTRILTDNLLIGICEDVIFLFDMNKGEITWKKVLGSGQKIYAVAVAPDQSVYINYMFRSALNFKITKFNFTITNASTIEALSTDVAELTDQDSDEKYKPTEMLVAPDAGNRHCLYVTGLLSMYKVNI